MGTGLRYTEELFHSVFSAHSNVLASKGATFVCGLRVSTLAVNVLPRKGRLFFGVRDLGGQALIHSHVPGFYSTRHLSCMPYRCHM